MNTRTFGVVLAAVVMLVQVSCVSVEIAKNKSGYVSRHLLGSLHEGMSREHCKLILGDPENVAVGDDVKLPVGRRVRSIRSTETWTYNLISEPPQLRSSMGTPRIGMPPQVLPAGGIRKVKLLFLNDMLAGINVENTTASSPEAVRLR